MPELPEVEALTAFLDHAAKGRRVSRCELGSLSALKTVDPPLDALLGTTVAGCARRGKFVCLDTGGLWLVLHLARGGWVRWYESVPATRIRPTRGPLALRVALEPDDPTAPTPGFDVTEAGTEKRLGIWVVRDLAEIEAVARLGPDPLEPGFDRSRLAGALAGAGGNLKHALTSQSALAGVGNAYSDEALHAARLSPFKPVRTLTDEELDRLCDGLVGVLTEATERAAGLGAEALKGDKKRAMRVHGRAGQPCPVCADTIREVSFATSSLQYCPTCQTGGKPLADRRLSRLLK